MNLNVRTISTEQGQMVKVQFPEPCSEVLVKNFGGSDIWIATDENGSKTQGMVRIPPSTGQVIVKNIPTVQVRNPWITEIYIYADSAMTDAVEIQPVR